MTGRSASLLSLCGFICALLPAPSRAAESGGRKPSPPVKLPVKILSGYNGYWLNTDSLPVVIENMLDPMRAAGFTAVDLKIQPPEFNLADPAQLRRLKELSDAARARDLVLLAYVYPTPHTGVRNSRRDADLPAFVRADGTAVETRFSLIHWPTWRRVFDNAFQLARVSRDLGIPAVRLDIENLQNGGISYDDPAWRQFAPLYHLDPGTSASRRLKALQSRKLVPAYEEWHQSRLDEVAKRFEREMHKINPDLSLGIMPCHGALVDSFIKYLATPRAPAIMDSWDMYNGEGYTPQVLQDQARVKKANPNNLFIPWFRINSYRPTDIAVQAYYAAKMTDGYSNWDMYMVYKDARKHRGVYGLPDGFSPADYFRAYRQANEWVRSDLAKGIKDTRSAAFKPVTPLAPALKLDGLTIPDLRPAGDGSGWPAWIALRNQQTVYVYVRDGETLDIDVAHLAGARRMVSLRCLVLSKARKILAEDTVVPGARKKIALPGLKAGVYALVVSGGEGGLAWYGVRVNNHHMGVPAQSGTDFFYINRPLRLYVSRTSPTTPARVRVSTRDPMIVAAKMNDGPATVGQDVTFDLPADSTVSVITVDKPATVPDGMYVQEFGLTTEGAVAPYVSDGPERRLTTP